MRPKTKYATSVSGVLDIIAEHINTHKLIIEPAKVKGEYAVRMFKRRMTN